MTNINEKVQAAIKKASVATAAHLACNNCQRHHEPESEDWWLSGPQPDKDKDPDYLQVLCATCLAPVHAAYQDVKRFWNTKGRNVYAPSKE